MTEYLTRAKAKFPRINFADMRSVAGGENAAMKRTTGLMNAQGNAAQRCSNDKEGREKLRRNTIWETLTRPMTYAQLFCITGLAEVTGTRSVMAMAQEGILGKRRVGKQVFWYRIEKNDDPKWKNRADQAENAVIAKTLRSEYDWD